MSSSIERSTITLPSYLGTDVFISFPGASQDHFVSHNGNDAVPFSKPPVARI